MFSLVSIGIYIFAFLIIYAQLSGFERLTPNDKKGKMSISLAVFLAIFAFLIRIFAAGATAGHPTDMKCWTYWGSRLYSLYPWNFYDANVFADYPPLYMYVLWLIGSLCGSLHLPSFLVLALYKLPAIIGDIALAFVIYNIASKHSNKKLASALFFFAAFNPLSYFNSVIWGQMDSLLVLFMLLSLYALYEEKYLKSAFLFVLAVLLKPQALMFAPIYLFAFIKTKDIRLILKAVLLGIITVIAVSFLFSPALRGGGNIFVRLLKALNPLWLIDKYVSTLSSYDYVSVNAFNLPALLGGNWKDSLTPFFFLPWKLWGFLCIAAAVFWAGILYYKTEDKAARIFVPAFFIIAFLFAFGTKMHERYIYPSIVFLLILYIFSKKRAFLWLFTGMSFANLLNLEYSFYCAANGNIMPKQIYVSLIAAMQISLIIVSFYIIYHTYYKKSNVSSEKTEKNYQTCAKITKLDWIFIAAITVLYSAVAFFNLGDLSAPQTFASPCEGFTAELYEEAEIDKITCYFGISNTLSPAAYEISISSDGENWSDASECLKLNGTFRQSFAEIKSRAKYIRFTPNATDISVGEIGIISEDSVLKIKSVVSDSKKPLEELYDEQEVIAAEYSYKNGTYFDEIYHPRSAYELLNGLSYYETTHPPLGKIIISLGIKLFGMTPFGWRAAGTLFGVLMCAAIYILLKKLFKRTTVSLFGTILLASDFMHFSLTRLGTIDSYPVLFIILMYLFMYIFITNLEFNIKSFGTEFFKAKDRRALYLPLLLSGIFSGLGIASKWIAIYALFGLAVIFFVWLILAAKNIGFKEKAFKSFLLRLLPWCVLCFVLIPFLIYLLSYIPVARCEKVGLFRAFWENQKYMLSYHSKLTATHPYSSKWYEWPIVARPLLAYYKANGNSHSAIAIMGNPILFWGGIFAFFHSIYVGIKTKDKTALFLIIGLLAQLLPWVFVTRCTFIYHFFASEMFMIALICYSARHICRRNPKLKIAVLLFLTVCVLSFVLFYPVLSGTEVSNAYVSSHLLWFNNWVF